MKICISRIDKLGDMILTLPVIKSLKSNNANIEIHLLASEKNFKVLKNLEYIDKVFLINSKNSMTFQEISKVRKIKYDLFLNFSPTIQSYMICFFSNSLKKATLIFLSRYKENIFSKVFLRITCHIFCNVVYLVNRFERIKKNIDIHQTNMMFNLVDKCNLKHSKNTPIHINLPKKQINFFNNRSIVLHLSDRWINDHYTEKNFLELIDMLLKKKYSVLLTSDKSTRNKFSKIYDLYKIISNSEFQNLKEIKNTIIILENLNFENWIKIISSSKVVITPESGCTHIAAACGVLVNIIYDPNNLPQAINKEYEPWKSKYNKFIFNEIKLNQKLINSL